VSKWRAVENLLGNSKVHGYGDWMVIVHDNDQAAQKQQNVVKRDGTMCEQIRAENPEDECNTQGSPPGLGGVFHSLTGCLILNRNLDPRQELR
jgi:hypothetical protein